MADLQTAIPYIRKAEGGLSRTVTDTASKNPAPWSYKGQTGWHTNKGITYTTFSTLAAELGYDNTADNFFTMPDSIWLKIYKNGYWDKMKADLINSEAIAVAIVDYAWGFGAAGATNRLKAWLKSTYNIVTPTITDIVNSLNTLTQNGDTDVFNKLIIHRKAAFAALNQPANESGWLKRMDDLKNFGSSLLKTIVQNKGTAGAIFFLLHSHLLMPFIK